MSVVKRKLSKSFKAFFDSEKAGGILLIVCTVVSLALTNSPIGVNYLTFWQFYLGGLSLEHWVNDALMAVFFLLIGLELERELYNGELSDFKNALLPIFARFKLEARFRRRTFGRHRFYDVNFHHKSCIYNESNRNKRLENGDSAGFFDRRNNRLFVAQTARTARRFGR